MKTNLSTLTLISSLFIASIAFAGSEAKLDSAATENAKTDRKVSSTDAKDSYESRIQQIKLRKYLNRRVGRLEDR